jgi:hypothetical protein
VAAVVVDGAAGGVAVGERARVVAGSRVARLREELPEPGGRLPKRLPAEGARQLAAVLRPIEGRRSVRPAEQRSPGELPAAPQVEAGLRSNQAHARRLPQAAPALLRERVRPRGQPSRPVARESELAWRPDSAQLISRALELELAPRTYSKRAEPAPPACRNAWPGATG